MRFLFVLLSTAMLFSCKKEKQPEPASNTGGSTDGLPSNATSYYGVFSLKRFAVQDIYDSLYIAPGIFPATVSFSSSPVTVSQQPTAITVDSVSLNGVRLKYTDPSYEDTTYTDFTAPFEWKVDGSGIIRDIRYINTNTYPVFADHAGLPDSVKSSVPFVLNLTGLSNYNKLVLILSDSNGNFVFSEPAGNSNTQTITFPVSDLDDFTPHSNITLMVWLFKYDVRSFGGKAFNFTTEYILTNQVYVK